MSEEDFFGEGDRNIAMVEGVNLFDLAGNVYLRTSLLHYERIETKNPFVKKPTLREIFAPVSSRLIRVLLLDPNKKWFVSELAEEADVSLALAYRIVEKLLEDKLLEKATGREVVVKSPGELLDRWTQAKQADSSYATSLKNRYTFYSHKQEVQAILETIVRDNQNLKYALSFFTGAYLIAPFVTTLTKVQMYIANSEDLDTWRRILDLTPVDRGGNVEIFPPYDKGVFYGMQSVPFDAQNDTIQVVSNVQLYLDLINNPARGEEQAKHIREVRLHY